MVASMPRGDARRIGQTRRLSATRHGILRPAAESVHFHLERLEPSDDVRPLKHRRTEGAESRRVQTLPPPHIHELPMPRDPAYRAFDPLREFAVYLPDRPVVRPQAKARVRALLRIVVYVHTVR